MFKNLISLLLVILISACYQALKLFKFYKHLPIQAATPFL